MADPKPVPPSASAEGETAALQAQAVEASTIDTKDAGGDVSQPNAGAAAAKKGSNAGLKNYLVGTTFDGFICWLT